MSVKINAYWEPLRTLPFGSIAAMFLPLGGPLTAVSRNIKINNQTDVLLQFSTDGVNSMFVVPAMSGAVWDIAACRVAESDDCGIKVNTQIFVLGTPTLGSVYLETIFIN